MHLPSHLAGQRAEQHVFNSLSRLPPPWQYFPSVEWRTLQRDGEIIGEADVVVFHPQHGLIIFEIKAGAVQIQEGKWHYASGQPMKCSPFSQARRNRFALIDKLRQRLSQDSIDSLTITHAAWFPDVVWKAPLPGVEAPSKAFLFDRTTLADPEPALLRLFREATSTSRPWTKSQQQVLKELLAPDCHLLVPLAVQVADTVVALHQATDQQISVLRMLRSQPRLLVEGGAGTGKTLLACTLAREHAALGKSVLLTCFNRQLALHISLCLAGIPQIQVANFHELVKQTLESSGLPHVIPDDPLDRAKYFREGAAEELLNATEFSDSRYDTIIVDEAADFAPTWWVALEALGQKNFSWYCFYDRQQSLYQDDVAWQPPFAGMPITLDINLRNPKPIGEFAARVGGSRPPSQFRVDQGINPVTLISEDFTGMATQLRTLLRDLIRKESILPEQIVVLAPYKHTNSKSTWASGLDDVEITTDMALPKSGKIRVGTIQGFKGLEADVVILTGIDAQAARHPEWLYVGASRARGMLYVLGLTKAQETLASHSEVAVV